MNTSLAELWLYLVIYGALGWVGETCVMAVKERQFTNRRFLNLPLSLPYGITAVLLLIGLPELPNGFLEYLLCLVVLILVRVLSDQVLHNFSGQQNHLSISAMNLSPLPRGVLVAFVAGICLAVYWVVHPMIMAGVNLMPRELVDGLAVVTGILVLLDGCSVLYTLRTHRLSHGAQRRQANTDRLSQRMTRTIRNRLDRAYPGIFTPDPSDDGNHTFAYGICLDKLIWVFLVSSFLGALIEMLYCRCYDGYFMNRSSLLYGSFSVVWGIGAVVLTVTLKNLADKADRYIFLAGFFIGGTYEYLCSLFTELLFGTVFWDYSHLPLNIGGRTNVLYCIFWGLLAVLWLKVLYPKMSKLIELIPPLQGKLLTWLLVLVMLCNGVLTTCAMLRYTQRQSQPEPENVVEAFLDRRYDDAFMEKRWPNMKLVD